MGYQAEVLFNVLKLGILCVPLKLAPILVSEHNQINYLEFTLEAAREVEGKELKFFWLLEV